MIGSPWVGAAQQPLMISGSQDGTAKLLQIQTKRVLATFAHDRNEATAGTVYEEQKAENSTENSVEWCVRLCRWRCGRVALRLESAGLWD